LNNVSGHESIRKVASWPVLNWGRKCRVQ